FHSRSPDSVSESSCLPSTRWHPSIGHFQITRLRFFLSLSVSEDHFGYGLISGRISAPTCTGHFILELPPLLRLLKFSRSRGAIASPHRMPAHSLPKSSSKAPCANRRAARGSSSGRKHARAASGFRTPRIPRRPSRGSPPPRATPSCFLLRRRTVLDISGRRLRQGHPPAKLLQADPASEAKTHAVRTCAEDQLVLLRGMNAAVDPAELRMLPLEVRHISSRFLVKFVVLRKGLAARVVLLDLAPVTRLPQPEKVRAPVFFAQASGVFGFPHRAVKIVRGIELLPGHAFDQSRELVDETQMPHMDESAVTVGEITAQPAEPGAVTPFGDLDAEILEGRLADRAAEPQKPLLPVLAFELMPLEAVLPQPIFRDAPPLALRRFDAIDK